MVGELKITPEMIKHAHAETERLSREMDITNADHVALWLEANDPYDGDAWLAIQIIEAHERATAPLHARVQELEAENFALAAGACINPNGNGLLGDEHGNSFCGVEQERLRLDERETDLMARVNELESNRETLLTAVREMWDALKPFAQETAFSRAAGSLKQTTRLPLEDYERASATLTKYAGIGE